MTPEQTLRVLVMVHRGTLRRLPHPTRDELTMLDYASQYLEGRFADDTLSRVANAVRRAVGERIARGRPSSEPTVRVRASVRLVDRVRDEARRRGTSMVQAVRELVGALEPVTSDEPGEPGACVLRVHLSVVQRHGDAAGLRRALEAALSTCEQR